MKNLILAVLLFPLLLAAQATPQCTDYTVSATGRTLVLTNARVDLVSGQFTYYTTGSPTGVSATVEAGNKAVAVQTPFTKISAVTDTAGADMGTAAGAYRYWWINLGTLSGGTKPTVVFTACFSPTAWSRFAWPATGISGGLLGFTSPTTLASSVLQTANALIVGGGAGATPTPLALGAANTAVGMNAAGTANEYKALGVGTTGTDFNIAHTPNFVTFHLPDASGTARGAVTPGAQTLGGPKTFFSNITINYGHLKFISQVKPGAPTSNAPTDGGACTDGSHVIATTFVTGNGETEYGAVSAAQTCVLGTTKQTIPMSAIPTGITGVTTGRNMCASKAGTVTPLYQVGASPTIADNSTTTYDFVTADASLTVACNATNTTSGGFWVDGTKRLSYDPASNGWAFSGYMSLASPIYAYGGIYSVSSLTMTGLTSLYNNIPTVAGGVPAEYALADLTAQTAAVGATVLYAVPAAGVGRYRISWEAKITTAATTSSVLGGVNGFQVTYTHADDSVALTPLAVPNAVATGNTTATQLSGSVIAYAKASTNISYQYDYTSVGATPMAYSLHVLLERQ